MHLKLSENEVVIKIFDYAKSGRQDSSVISQNSLVVTNKRIIQQAKSRNAVIRKEIPVQDAKYINTQFFKKHNPVYNVLAVLAIVAGVACAMALKDWTFAAIGAGVGVLLFVAYAFLTKNMLAFSIGGDNRLTQLMTFTTQKPKKEKPGKKTADKENYVFFRVNKKQAIQLVDELGSVILDVREAFANPAPVVVEEPEVEAEEEAEITE
ncbi:MAG: hypothetical protein IJX62_07515 [Clostridia bacterium]|nr:hypothetical protein [Clostridia bacterium]